MGQPDAAGGIRRARGGDGAGGKVAGRTKGRNKMTWQTYVICALCVLIALACMGLLYIQSQDVANTAKAAVEEALQSSPDLAQQQRAVTVCVAGLVNNKSCNVQQTSTATEEAKQSDLLWVLLFMLMVVCICAPCAVFLSWLLGGSEVRMIRKGDKEANA